MFYSTVKKTNIGFSLKTKKGLHLPIVDDIPKNAIVDLTSKGKTFALIGTDYIGLKASFLVKINDTVKAGQSLFIDKKNPKVVFVSPVAGKITAINRGEKRLFHSITIKVASNRDNQKYKSFSKKELLSLDRNTLISILLERGMWPFLRQRPFSVIPNSDTTPHSLFITAIDTNPLAIDPDIVLDQERDDFTLGVQLLSKLTENTTFVCQSASATLFSFQEENIQNVSVDGPHPVGNVGTHIHFLDPVDENKTVWYIYYQHVLNIVKTLLSGIVSQEKVISISGGTSDASSKIVKVISGVCIDDILDAKVDRQTHRVISGSVFSGRNAMNEFGFLGCYYYQVCILSEKNMRSFLGWQMPGFNLFSIKNVVFSKLFYKKLFYFNTNTYGSKRAIIPIGSYEKVVPLDIMPTYLLRSLEVNDVEQAIKLGILDLDEEDISLCSFVCPSKLNFEVFLRRMLDSIREEL